MENSSHVHAVSVAELEWPMDDDIGILGSYVSDIYGMEDCSALEIEGNVRPFLHNFTAND